MGLGSALSIDLMNQYRKLDDSITMRLNRTNAQFRDLDRLGVTHGNVQDQACAHLWKDLVSVYVWITQPECTHPRRELEA